MSAKEVALWARTRAQTFRIEAKRTIETTEAMKHSPAEFRAARDRYAIALAFCADILDECADELSKPAAPVAPTDGGIIR